jgi:hypothetical protein
MKGLLGFRTEYNYLISSCLICISFSLLKQPSYLKKESCFEHVHNCRLDLRSCHKLSRQLLTVLKDNNDNLVSLTLYNSCHEGEAARSVQSTLTGSYR